MADNGNNPNINLFQIERVENIVNQAVCGLLEIEPENAEQLELKNKCMSDLKDLQDGNLLDLRRSLE